MIYARTIAASLLVACSAGPPPSASAPTPETPPAPAPDQGPARQRALPRSTGGPTTAPPSELGTPCDHGACAAPTTCVKYYGIAGPRGPEFSSCEISCGDAKTGCPTGTRCVTIADGPGAVCRPAE